MSKENINLRSKKEKNDGCQREASNLYADEKLGERGSLFLSLIYFINNKFEVERHVKTNIHLPNTRKLDLGAFNGGSTKNLLLVSWVIHPPTSTPFCIQRIISKLYFNIIAK